MTRINRERPVLRRPRAAMFEGAIADNRRNSPMVRFTLAGFCEKTPRVLLLRDAAVEDEAAGGLPSSAKRTASPMR